MNYIRVYYIPIDRYRPIDLCIDKSQVLITYLI